MINLLYYVIRTLCIVLPQIISYAKHFESNKTMSSKISDNKPLKKQIQIWKKIQKNLLNTKFDSEPFYGDNDKYIKTKVKTYDSNVNTNFQGKKEPPENASYKSVINNARFCYQIKKYYVLSSNTLGRIQI